MDVDCDWLVSWVKVYQGSDGGYVVSLESPRKIWCFLLTDYVVSGPGWALT